MSCCVAGLGTLVEWVKVSLSVLAECYCATVSSEEGHVDGWIDGWTGRSGNSEPEFHNFPPMYRAILIKVRQGI
jgi:hypothetical protein